MDTTPATPSEDTDPVDRFESEPAPARRPRRWSARRLLGSLLVAGLVLAAGIGVGASTRDGSTSSSGTSAPAVPSASASAPSSSGSLDVAAISAKVNPGIVNINTTLANNVGAAAGTGMVISSSGEVLTNNHVIRDAATISVRVAGSERAYPADVVGYDVTEDVAVLQMRGASGLSTVPTAKSAAVSIGEPVVALGNALGQGGTPTATQGVISAVGQSITASDEGANAETLHGLIQVNAEIQPGDSGGPLVNASAQVIGMDTAASASGGLQQAQPTVGFAIPINTALSIAHQIEAGQSTNTVHIGARAMLGVQLPVATSGPGRSASGAQVAGVQAGSPAASIGLVRGDSIVFLNGTPISTATDLTTALEPFHPGDTVTVVWIDTAGRQHTATATLASGPPA